MAKTVTRKGKPRRAPTVTQHIERAERARVRGQLRHHREMRDLSRRLKATLHHTDLALHSLIREVAPRVGLQVIDRTEWERAVSHHRDVLDQLAEARRQVRELQEVRGAEVEA